MGLQRTIKAPVRVARGAFRLGRGLWRRVSPQASADTGEVTGSPPAPEPPPAAAPPLDIRVEETPNPEARKLVFDYVVVPEGSVVASAQGAGAPAWVDALFEVGGVRTVFATRDFITVTRSPEGPPWPSLLPQLERALQASLPRGASTRS